ncbi:MAG: hypothetical protein PUB21_11655 [Bacteroidales bacterium]|nr:hypothetical protein [Bacteroidales bacterium]
MFNVAHIHPMLVHFPIALGLLGWLLAAVALVRRSSFPCGEIILYFAVLSAIAAASAGAFFTPDFTVPKLMEAKNIHSTFAGITVTMFCVAGVFYIGRHLFKKYSVLFRNIGFVFYSLAAVFVAVTGYFGGVLVYNDLLKM